MEIFERKPRRVETPEEKATRIGLRKGEALNRALAEQDAIDAMVRRSIERHGS
jgi:hypothetical protein